MMKISVKKHSKLAIASTILPISIWLYLLALYGLFFYSRTFTKFLNWILGDSFGALGAAFILAIFLVLIIPIAGHITGAIFAVIGIFAKNKKRIFAVIGLILNILPLVAGLIIYQARHAFGY